MFREVDPSLKEEAIKLRGEEKLPLKEIARKLGVAKSTISRWLDPTRETPKEKLPRIYTPETKEKLRMAARKGNSLRQYKRLPIEELKSPRSIRERIFEERGRKCEKCGWSEANPFTGDIPVQVDHKDGNRKNNKPENLIIVCPNCHSLTEFFMFYGRSHQGTYGKKGTARYR